MSGRGESNRAFLENIRAEPDDDALRLIYADWLEENEDPARAEFIRVQCKLARGSGTKERQAELEAREFELLSRNRGAWLGPLAKELPYKHCTFRRGFPEEVTVRPKVAVKLAEEFDARIPAGRVTLCGGFGDPSMKALMDCPCLGWVVGLKYEHPSVTDAGLEMIGNSANLPYLAELSVQFGKFTTNGLRALMTSPHRAALRRLDLDRCSWERTPPATADALAAPGVLFRLRSLTLHDHGLGPTGAAALAGTVNLAEVKELDLLLNDLGDEGAIALARSPYLRGLSSLVLQTNGLTSRAVRELAASPLLDGIRNLNLGVNDIGDKGAEALAASPRLASLERLNLFSTGLTDRGAKALASSPYLSNLKDLDLWNSALTGLGGQFLFESPLLPRLARIGLVGQLAKARVISQRQRKQWLELLDKGAQV